MRHKPTVRWVVAMLPLLIALSACDVFLGESQLPPCECPNTETIVWNIDWLGDGSTADSFTSRQSDQGWPYAGVAFDRFNDKEEARTALLGIYARMEAAGLVTPNPDAFEVEFAVGNDVIVGVTSLFAAGDGEAEFWIDVNVLPGDADASAALQSLVEALGTID